MFVCLCLFVEKKSENPLSKAATSGAQLNKLPKLITQAMLKKCVLLFIRCSSFQTNYGEQCHLEMCVMACELFSCDFIC